ncbi:MAG: tRNA lysidine(34) synthetase TilS [Candidatus Andersenbacteria bacterium]
MAQAPHTTPLELVFADESLRHGETLVVAVSGGADSMVLLELLACLRTSRELTLHVAHVNYGLRGLASQRDERLVRRRAKELGLFVHIEQTNALQPTSPNLEERAREIRYRFLRETAAEIKANAIVLGHTQDDQVETVLLRLLRGSGLTGLSAMQVREGMFVRPLLGASRQTVRAYAHARGIPHREDASNRDLRFARNRVRHVLLPMLHQYFNPNLGQTLVESAQLITEDEHFLQELTDTLYRKLVKEQRATETSGPAGQAVLQASIASQELMQLPRALQRRLVRAMTHRLAPRQRLGHSRALEQALRGLAQDERGVKFPLGGRLTLHRSQGTVRLTF